MTTQPSGYSGTLLAKKLGLKPNMNIILMNEPADYFNKIEMPKTAFNIIKSEKSNTDFIHLFSTSTEQLTNQLSEAIPALKHDGMLWISWSKGVKTFNRENVREIGLATGLVDIKVAAFDEQWSGLKFVYRTNDRN